MAGKTDELVQVIEKLDVRTLGQSYQVMNLMQNLMMINNRNRGQAMALFKKAWEAFPAERQNLFSYAYQTEFWQMPEMYGYARQALIPDDASGPFQAAARGSRSSREPSTGSDGSITSIVSRLLDLAASAAPRRRSWQRISRRRSGSIRPGPPARRSWP